MVYVVKHSGEKAPYDPGKVEHALRRSGGRSDVIKKVLGELDGKVHDGITTHEIYDIAFKLLDSEDHVSATRYGLKRAIMELGPSGFPFEKYFAALLQEHGYETQLNQTLEGACATHEIDIIAVGPEGKILVECKYHNRRGEYTGLKESMYTWARFQDCNEADAGFDTAWLVTNTRVSSEGVRYAGCKGMMTTGWRHPADAGIENMIESRGLYPVTILRSVDEKVKKRLCDANLMIVKLVADSTLKELSSLTKLSDRKVEALQIEARQLLDRQ